MKDIKLCKQIFSFSLSIFCLISSSARTSCYTGLNELNYNPGKTKFLSLSSLSLSFTRSCSLSLDLTVCLSLPEKQMNCKKKTKVFRIIFTFLFSYAENLRGTKYAQIVRVNRSITVNLTILTGVDGHAHFKSCSHCCLTSSSSSSYSLE